MAIYPAQTLSFVLYGSGASSTDTSITLVSMKQIDGTLLTMAKLGSISYATLEPGATGKEEQISFTGITQNDNGTATLTGVKSVLNVTPYTETSGLSQSHSGGTKAVLSNTSGFYNALFASINKLNINIATTEAGTLISDFENGDEIDGVTLATGDTILIKDQADESENGVYVVNSSGAPTRAGFASSDATLRGSFYFVALGTINGSTIWRNTNTSAITVGVTDITFTKDLNSNISGNASTVTTNANLTGDITSVGNATSYAEVVPIAKGGTGETSKSDAFDALSPTTAKGDLIVHNGTDNIRLPIGSDNTYPKADSSDPAGIKWIAVAPGSGISADFTDYDNKTTPVADDLMAINDSEDYSAVKYIKVSTLGASILENQIFN